MSVWTRQRLLRRASAADLPAIMAIERQPGYEQLVGRWEEDQHVRNIARPGYLYLVHEGRDGAPVAFAALSGLGGRDGNVMINRMIVKTPGQGVGTLFLGAIMETVFEGSPAERILLRVLPDNLRALHVYRAQGFRQRQLLPQSGMTPDGRRVDLLLMSISYEEWAARNAK